MLVTADGRTVGSSLVGQCFGKSEYFWGRPSAAGVTDESPWGCDASSSAGTNLGETSLVDGSPASLRAVRRGAKLAGALHGALVALVVDTPEAERQTFDRNRDLQEAIDDAFDIGADVMRVEAKDVLSGMEEAARQRRATHLVLPYRETLGLRRVLERPLVDRLNRTTSGCRDPRRRGQDASAVAAANGEPF